MIRRHNPFRPNVASLPLPLMESPVYLLSDVHLGAGPPDVEAAKERDLVAFLGDREPGETVYLLGDVFDFWFDFRRGPLPEHEVVLRALGRAVDRGVAIAFMGGNHDRWLRRGRDPGWLERHLGIHVLDDPHVTERHGLALYLSHGDALGGATGAYRLVRAVLGHPLAIFGFSLLPRRLARRIAAIASRASRRSHDEEDRRRHRDLQRERAAEILAAEPVDAVVVGHTHLPERIETPHGVFLNLGDWITHRTFGRLANGRLTLERFRPD